MPLSLIRISFQIRIGVW